MIRFSGRRARRGWLFGGAQSTRLDQRETMKSLSLPVGGACLALIIAVTTFGNVSCERRRVAYQKTLDAMPFHFNDDEANASYSMKQCDDKWHVQTIAAPGSGMVTFKFTCTNNQILSLEGHSQSVFRIGDNTVYFAHFSPTKTGCAVAAYDLDNGKEVWRTELEGIGKVSHEQYRNRITIDLPDKDDKRGHVVWITGNETSGDYVEVLDRKTGKQLAHRVYRRSS